MKQKVINFFYFYVYSLIIYFILFLVHTNAENIIKLSLKQRILVQNSRNISIDIYSITFQSELMKSYSDMNYTAALIHNRVFFYEIATYFYEDVHGSFNKNYLHTGDIVMIQEQNYGESYAIVEAIFSHRSNNDNLYAFVIVQWFERNNSNKTGLSNI